jgi:hypothetical protein
MDFRSTKRRNYTVPLGISIGFGLALVGMLTRVTASVHDVSNNSRIICNSVVLPPDGSEYRDYMKKRGGQVIGSVSVANSSISPSGSTAGYVQLYQTHPDPIEVTILLTDLDGATVTSNPVTIPADSSYSNTFTITAGNASDGHVCATSAYGEFACTPLTVSGKKK